MSDKERYATTGVWAEVFRKEGTPVSIEIIRTRLKEAEVIGQTARMRFGKLVRHGFYSESDVRRVVSPYLQNLPQADESGTFEKNGETYGTASSLSRLFWITRASVGKQVKAANLSGIQGRDSSGQLQTFYPLSEIQTLCANLLQDFPQAEEDGTFEKDGEIYGTPKSFSRIFGISELTVGKHIKRSDLQGIQGKDSGGQIRIFYPLSEIQTLCADYLQDIPLADEEGKIEIAGKIYGTISSLSKLLPVSNTKIRKIILENGIKSIRGKDRMGHVLDFYCLFEVRDFCGDSLSTLPRADKSGLLEIDGESYGTLSRLAKLLTLPEDGMKATVTNHSLKSRRGIDKGGSSRDFYAVSEVRRACAKLLEDIPVADENGFFEENGQTFGYFSSFSRLFGISGATIKKAVMKVALESRRGKDKSGHPYDFFEFSAVRRACAHLLGDVPVADENGIFEKDGDTYGTIASLAKFMNVSVSIVKKTVEENSLASVKGKDRLGHLRDFYSLSSFREFDLERFSDLPVANEQGFFEKDGDTYGMVFHLSERLGVPRPSIQRRIRQVSLQPMKAKNVQGGVYDFYSMTRVQEICADLIAKKSNDR